jgi:hypothetical protein
MAAAATVVCGTLVETTVVVVKNEVLAFISDDVRNPLPVALVFGDDESCRVEREDHSRRINITTLIVTAAGVLSGGDSNVRGVLSRTVFAAIGPRDKDSVVAIVQAIAISVTLSHSEELCESAIDRVENFTARCSQSNHSYTVGCRRDDAKAVTSNLLSTRDETRIDAAAALREPDSRTNRDAQDNRYDKDLISQSAHFKKVRPAKLLRVSG